MRTTSIIRQLAAKRYMVTMKGLPFRITRKEAHELFAKDAPWLGEGKNLDNPAALIAYEYHPVTSCFLPFHSASVSNLSAIFDCQYGKDRTEYYWSTMEVNKVTVPVLKSRIVTDWYDCTGTLPPTSYPFGTPETQIFAAFSYPRFTVEHALQTVDAVKAIPITNDMLTFEGEKKRVFAHNMNMPYALEKLSSRLYDLEKNRARRYILDYYRADHVNFRGFEVTLDQADFRLHSYFVATWVYEMRSGKYTSYSFLNAYNGDIYGRNILSIRNTATAGGVAGAAIGLVFAVTAPYSFVARALITSAFSLGISGISSLYARWHNGSQSYEFVETQKEEKENQYFPESDDDKARRAYAEKINMGTEYTEHRTRQKVRLPIDKCKLLGLDPADDITPEKVQAAFNKQIRKWHPDLFRNQNAERQRLAGEMSRQIITARDELNSILKPKQ